MEVLGATAALQANSILNRRTMFTIEQFGHQEKAPKRHFMTSFTAGFFFSKINSVRPYGVCLCKYLLVLEKEAMETPVL